MFKKTITYTDYNGQTRTEDFYFNLNDAEKAEMELSQTGGMTDYIQKIIVTQDTPTLVQLFKKIILMAYGEKSADGRRFVKVDDFGRKLSVGFSQTEAYSQLFMELATNADSAVAFINGALGNTKVKPESMPTDATPIAYGQPTETPQNVNTTQFPQGGVPVQKQ